MESKSMEKTIIEGNKLIAEFDGWKLSYTTNDGMPCYKKFDRSGAMIHAGIFHHPEYHDNWSTLMPVWKKLYNEIWALPPTVTIEYLGEQELAVSYWYNQMEQPLTKVLIEPAWQTLVEAISWYNSQGVKPAK